MTLELADGTELAIADGTPIAEPCRELSPPDNPWPNDCYVYATAEAGGSITRLAVLTEPERVEAPEATPLALLTVGIDTVGDGSIVLIEGHELQVQEDASFCQYDAARPMRPENGLQLIVERASGIVIRGDCFAMD
jgi:hypothetical protein